MASGVQDLDASKMAITPIMVQPDYTPFQLRKAALKAACAVQGSQSVKVFVSNLEAFENYLKDGTKP